MITRRDRKLPRLIITNFLVEEDGFGPSKPKQQIYSLPPLTTRELLHMAAKAAFHTSTDCRICGDGPRPFGAGRRT